MQPRTSSTKSKFKFVLLYFFITGFCTALMFYFQNRYAISHVQVQSVEMQDLFGTGKYWNKNLFFADVQDVENYLLDKNPTLKSVSVEKRFPDTLVVFPVRLAKVAKVDNGDQQIAVATDGTILAIESDKEKLKTLPTINFYQTIPSSEMSIGKTLSYPEIPLSLYFYAELTKLGLKTNNIDIKGFHMLGLDTDKGTVLFSADKDKEEQVYHVEQVYRNIISKDTRKMRSLDVRFDKPVISFE